MLHTKKGGVLSVLGAMLLSTTISGLSLADGPVISGYVDTQYGYSFNQPNTGTVALRSYDAQDNNIANTAHIAVMGNFGEGVGYVVEFDGGHDANTTAGPAGSSEFVVQEAFVNYTSDSKWGFKVGKFVTFQGIEVIETGANPTISRGYLFGLAEPFTHVGGVATLALGKLDFAAGVVNGWDQANDNNQGKTFVGKIGLNLGDPLVATLSGYHGPEQTQISSGSVITDSRSGVNRDSIDLTVLTKIIPKVDLFLQGNYGTEAQVADFDGDTINDDRGSWSGAGIQPVIHFTDKFSLGARLEYFDDGDGVRAGTNDASYTNITVTPGYKVTDNILVRAEYRHDSSNKKVWVDDKGTAEDSSDSAALQFLVSF